MIDLNRPPPKVTRHQKRTIVDRAAFQDLQALEDAIEFRTARAAAPCPDCHPEALSGKCDDHAIDIDLIAAYQRTAAGSPKP